MKCPDREQLSRFLDGEPGPFHERLRAHIRVCRRCREEAEKEGALGDMLREFFGRYSRRAARDAAGCPLPEEIALYAEARVPLYRRKELLRHFCGCPACAHAVVDAAGAAGREFPEPPEAVLREAQARYSARRSGGGRGPRKII